VVAGVHLTGNIVAPDHDVAEHFIFSFMSIARSPRLRPRAESGLRAGQYDGPTIGIGAKSLPLYRRVWSPVTARRSGKGGERSTLVQLRTDIET
jgi:hypothetical protein